MLLFDGWRSGIGIRRIADRPFAERDGIWWSMRQWLLRCFPCTQHSSCRRNDGGCGTSLYESRNGCGTSHEWWLQWWAERNVCGREGRYWDFKSCGLSNSDCKIPYGTVWASFCTVRRRTAEGLLYRRRGRAYHGVCERGNCTAEKWWYTSDQKRLQKDSGCWSACGTAEILFRRLYTCKYGRVSLCSKRYDGRCRRRKRRSGWCTDSKSSGNENSVGWRKSFWWCTEESKTGMQESSGCVKRKASEYGICLCKGIWNCRGQSCGSRRSAETGWGSRSDSGYVRRKIWNRFDCFDGRRYWCNGY